MVRLPVFQSISQELMLLQTKWAAILNNLLGNPSLDTQILFKISLLSGANVINHKLGRKLVGWRIVGISAAITLYDSQASNQTPDLTLILNASGPAVINLEVF